MNEKKHTCTSICPSLEFLENQEIVTNVVCTVPNCEEIFLNQSNLNFHLEKVHRIKANVKCYIFLFYTKFTSIKITKTI